MSNLEKMIAELQKHIRTGECTSVKDQWWDTCVKFNALVKIVEVQAKALESYKCARCHNGEGCFEYRSCVAIEECERLAGGYNSKSEMKRVEHMKKGKGEE